MDEHDSWEASHANAMDWSSKQMNADYDNPLKNNMFMNIRLCFLLFGVMLTGRTFAQRRYEHFDDYIRKYSSIAVEQMRKHNIPASITMAQGILESGAGTSPLAVATNNHFGIKKGANWNGPVYEHPDDSQHDLFRVYDNVAQSYEDHSAILLKPRYQKLFNLDIHDYKGWARGLKECGYATSPTYADRLINLIDTYELYRLDSQSIVSQNSRGGSSSMLEELSFDFGNSTQHDKNRNNNNVTDNRYAVGASSRQLVENNGIPCVIAKEGDSWKGLADELDVKLKYLLKYNEANISVPIQKGNFIYLAKKAAKGPKYMKKKWHKVSYGENMYFISQYYGIRLDKLYKMNFKSPDYVPRIGELLKVR